MLPERDVVDPAQHIEPMEKHHEDQVESTNLIEKMDPAAKNRGVVQGGLLLLRNENGGG